VVSSRIALTSSSIVPSLEGELTSGYRCDFLDILAPVQVELFSLRLARCFDFKYIHMSKVMLRGCSIYLCYFRWQDAWADLSLSGSGAQYVSRIGLIGPILHNSCNLALSLRFMEVGLSKSLGVPLMEQSRTHTLSRCHGSDALSLGQCPAVLHHPGNTKPGNTYPLTTSSRV